MLIIVEYYSEFSVSVSVPKISFSCALGINEFGLAHGREPSVILICTEHPKA